MAKISKEKKRNQPEKASDESFRFESWLGELTAELVNLPFESIDAAIETTMKKLVEFFGADRCHLGQFSGDRTKMSVPYFYSRPGINIPPITDIGAHHLPFVYACIREDKLIAFSKSAELPAKARQDRAVIDEWGIKSLLVIPLKINDVVRFGLSLSTVGKHRHWNEQTINQIKIVGNVLANVILRKFNLEQIEKEKSWAEAILEGMPQITYAFDLQGRLKRWNKNAEHLLGYTAEEMKDRFIGAWHSDEDLKKIWIEVEKIIEDGRERSVEYSFITKSGEILPFYYGSGKLAEIGGEQYIVGQTVDISEIKKAQERIAKQLEEIERLKGELEAENIFLRQELISTNPSSEIIGESAPLKHIFYRADQVAPLDTTVLLEGETGTGKELFARYIYQKSNRKDQPFITVNCASLPATLIESELFGHEKGAFTGAINKQLGRFELADGGTLFLDEVGEIPVELQAKLLRVLQAGEFERIGNPRTIKVDVRVIAATNRDLEQEVWRGRFRKDLYYRLNVFPITIVPLRKRLNDIPLLVEYFIKRFNHKLGKNITRIPKRVLKELTSYDWPGNIRELENIVERAMILSKSSSLTIEKLSPHSAITEEIFHSLADHEREYILKVLDQTMWRINGPKGAARILEIHPETLRSRMKKLGIKRP